jgi:two-component system, LytTR family, response regulator
MKLSCIAIDGEPLELELLKWHLSTIPSLDLKGQFTNGADALIFLQDHQIDVIFTEIKVPLMSGLELAALLPRCQKFIFVTHHKEYALRSFAHRVVDFIVKPLTTERFLEGIAKLTTERMNLINDQLFVKSGGEMVKINFSEILYIRGEREYVSLNFKDNRLLVYKRMKEMEGSLQGNFVRVHISYIVNLDHVVKIGAKYLTIGSEKIPISRSYRTKFLACINFKSW